MAIGLICIRCCKTEENILYIQEVCIQKISYKFKCKLIKIKYPPLQANPPFKENLGPSSVINLLIEEQNTKLREIFKSVQAIIFSTKKEEILLKEFFDAQKIVSIILSNE